jgi:hypothetical protein
MADGQLTGRELQQFEASLPDKAALKPKKSRQENFASF